MLIEDHYRISYSIISNNDVVENCEHRACFSELFRKNNTETKFVSVQLIKACYNYNHCILLEKEQIIEFLKYIKTIVRFDFTLEELDDRYVLNVELKDKKPLQIKFLFTCIRKLFEFPYNLALYDWFKLYKKRWKRIKKLTLLYFLDFCCDDNIHGLCAFRSFVPDIHKTHLKKYLKSNDMYLQNFLRVLDFKDTAYLNRLSFEYYQNNVNSEKILSKNAFDKRVNLYKEIYKKLKNENICR